MLGLKPKENVFILGAGASADSGGPLMKNFLDVAEDLYRLNKFSNKGRIEKVFTLIAELQSIHAKSYVDLDNIENLFGVIEMARITRKLLKYDQPEIDELRSSLIELIVETLEHSIKFYKRSSSIIPSPSY